MRHVRNLDDEPERGSSAPIKELVAKVLKQCGLGSDPALRRIVAAWREAAGTEFFEHTKVVGWKKGTLTVEVDSSALLQELAVYGKRELLLALKRAEPSVTEVKLRLGSRGAKRVRS